MLFTVDIIVWRYFAGDIIDWRYFAWRYIAGDISSVHRIIVTRPDSNLHLCASVLQGLIMHDYPLLPAPLLP